MKFLFKTWYAAAKPAYFFLPPLSLNLKCHCKKAPYGIGKKKNLKSSSQHTNPEIYFRNSSENKENLCSCWSWIFPQPSLLVVIIIITLHDSIFVPNAFSLVQFSHSIVSDSLRPHELEHASLPVHYQLPEFTQTHVHCVGDAIQPSHPLSSPSPPAPNPSQHQSLFQWVNSSQEVTKVFTWCTNMATAPIKPIARTETLLLVLHNSTNTLRPKGKGHGHCSLAWPINFVSSINFLSEQVSPVNILAINSQAKRTIGSADNDLPQIVL